MLPSLHDGEDDELRDEKTHPQSSIEVGRHCLDLIHYSAESVRTFFKDITGPPLARRGAGEDISVRGNLSRLQFPGGFVILAESQLGAECRYTVEDGDT